MTLLDVITKAVSCNTEPLSSQTEYPITLNADVIFQNLKSELENPNPAALVNPLTGWEISPEDAKAMDLSKNFFTKLKRKLKNTNSFNKEEFVGMLNSFLEKIREKSGISIGVDSTDSSYTRVLIEKVGSFMGRDVAGLVLEACVTLEIWEMVEALIVNGLLSQLCYSNLVLRLSAKRRSDLLCLCIKHASNLGSSELLCILKYFLCPTEDACSTMVNVRKEWESQALLAIEMAKYSFLSKDTYTSMVGVMKELESQAPPAVGKESKENVFRKNSHLAKQASILLMLAHDGFSDAELCLHFFLASSNVDEVILPSAVGKLNGKEMENLICYLGKWLKKYQRFPQAIPCAKASSILRLTACDSVPKLENVVKCLGLVLDENFSSLVLHTEFHEELKSIQEVVSFLALEARFCCLMANVVEKLRAGAMWN